jgi:hypothetical protein
MNDDYVRIGKETPVACLMTLFRRSPEENEGSPSQHGLSLFGGAVDTVSFKCQ